MKKADNFYMHLNVHTFSMKKVSNLIENCKLKGITDFKAYLAGYYGLYCIMYFGHKGTAYKRRKVKELTWFVNMYDIL